MDVTSPLELVQTEGVGLQIRDTLDSKQLPPEDGLNIEFFPLPVQRGQSLPHKRTQMQKTRSAFTFELSFLFNEPQLAEILYSYHRDYYIALSGQDHVVICNGETGIEVGRLTLGIRITTFVASGDGKCMLIASGTSIIKWNLLTASGDSHTSVDLAGDAQLRQDCYDGIQSVK